MKDIILILFISQFFQITSRCKTSGFSTYEECFTNEISEEEIRFGGTVDDYTCCYLRQLSSMDGQCLLVKNTDISNYTQILDEGGIPHDIFACSEDEMPDQSKSTECFLFNPIKKTDCFSRSLSDTEKGSDENYNINKCCYITFNNMEECAPVDSKNIDRFKEEFIQAHLKYGYIVENIEIICDDFDEESNESNKDSNENSDESYKDSSDSITDSSQLSKEPIGSNKDSNGSLDNIFRISYFIWLIILFA